MYQKLRICNLNRKKIWPSIDQQQSDLIKSLQEQIFLQNIIFNSIVFENKIPLLQQIKIQDNLCKVKEYFNRFINQNIQEKANQYLLDDNKVSSIRQIKDLKEKRLSNPEQHINYQKKQNIKDKSNSFNSNQLLQQQQFNNRASNQNFNFQHVDNISSNISNQQIPLIFQPNNHKSFLKVEHELLSGISNQFDRIYHFKKYFPHNNFQKVNQMLKKYQLEQKKQKKNHIGLKQRRQNIGLQSNMLISIFQENSNAIRFIPQDYNINLYKPTYLSYGFVKQINIINGILINYNYQQYIRYGKGSYIKATSISVQTSNLLIFFLAFFLSKKDTQGMPQLMSIYSILYYAKYKLIRMTFIHIYIPQKFLRKQLFLFKIILVCLEEFSFK
ncbi:hypothetical protein TTHERM_000163948 (macronuclear) [Tetrahymena thermophila SB210]|uniref:Uncharacterized protein n=1 Tax=Tetrahymena thermophila (strain SB210) TaxID=312017 RepID=W7XLF1_TETTS|nr:hypothetical protein TTHERM_000163948 [Tetrahymena thermophila SB210]EWS76179.1 hypothetical protein TTHERM_000163948 [Tetrahymena thermophila SB210]|eukprot:XP_012651226.1 hypothetical protein TTHERM_000163948 [Tetrahymena thermophila SB210]